MVMTIEARNVNEAYDTALIRMRASGLRAESRNGAVIKYPTPVVTTYSRPAERILWDPVRDVNSVFHLVESIWMLAGRADARTLLPFNARMAEFADDDGSIHGAYGRRWRYWFGRDQIKNAIAKLRANPQDRRVVVAMWDPVLDDDPTVRDIPCNTHIYFNSRAENTLDMTVCCRSNDMIWGAYGANVVHMSMLHELVAQGARMHMGKYTQFSNDFHIYPGMPNFDAIWRIGPNEEKDEYSRGAVPVPLLTGYETADDFLDDCKLFMDGGYDFKTYFMQEVAEPLVWSYQIRKRGGNYSRALKGIPDCDWKLSFQQWAERR